MIPYDDDDENFITVLGTQYMVQTDRGSAATGYCQGCAFNNPTIRLLLPEICKEVPCSGSDRWDERNIVLVEP